jgi:hypothetical protein
MMMRPLLFVLALPALALSGDATLTGPTYAGKLPPGITGGFAADLDSIQGQYLMSRRGDMLVALAFDDSGGFVPRCSLPLPAPVAGPDGGSPLATGSIVAAGDVDGDGLDEVVVAGNRTIRKYELIRGAFGLTAEGAVGLDSNTRPAWCFDLCIGDVNQDSVNEVLLAGVRSLPPFEPDGVDHPVKLFVCRWTGKELTLLWNDGGTLGLDGPSWVCPISRMVGVCDPTNSGHQRLLIEEGRSDVRASVFDELWWTSAGLHSRAYFVIRDRMIQGNVPDDNPVGSAITCDFARVGNKTGILASMLRDENRWLGEYFAFRGYTAAEHRVIWSDSDFDWWSPSTGIIIDLDGKGTGALRFMHPRPDEGPPRFEFYRL